MLPARPVAHRCSHHCAQVLHIPLKPPEGILEWLDRKGLLSHMDDEPADGPTPGDGGMLDEEFDLEEGDEEGTGVISDPSLLDQKDMGATMSDFM